MVVGLVFVYLNSRIVELPAKEDRVSLEQYLDIFLLGIRVWFEKIYT